jgi:hypothetical protein
MGPWIRQLRGALSLGFLGSLAGAAVAAVWELVSSLLGGVPINLEALVFWTLLGATVGGASGLGFSALVSILGAKATLRGLSVPKAGLWGGAAGVIASCLATYSLTGTLADALPFIAFCTAVGAAVGGGFVRVAQVAAARELDRAPRPQDLISDGGNQDVG